MNTYSTITQHSNNANNHSDIPLFFLYPSALFVSDTPHVVNTILGSCVSVCLHDPILNIGGINHFMLPLWNGQGLASPKYGNIAIEKLLQKLISLGSKQPNIKAKVFGGGEVIKVINNSSTFNIGQRNIELAKNMLKEKNIQIISESTGGNLGRKIQFFTSTGEVRQKFVEKNIPYLK